MTSPVLVDIPAAQDALARSDEGADPQPGDAALIAAYEGFCQQEGHRYQASVDAAEQAAWLAEQCRFHGPEGSTGPDCGDCPEGGDQA